MVGTMSLAKQRKTRSVDGGPHTLENEGLTSLEVGTGGCCFLCLLLLSCSKESAAEPWEANRSPLEAPTTGCVYDLDVEAPPGIEQHPDRSCELNVIERLPEGACGETNVVCGVTHRREYLRTVDGGAVAKLPGPYDAWVCECDGTWACWLVEAGASVLDPSADFEALGGTNCAEYHDADSSLVDPCELDQCDKEWEANRSPERTQETGCVYRRDVAAPPEVDNLIDGTCEVDASERLPQGPCDERFAACEAEHRAEALQRLDGGTVVQSPGAAEDWVCECDLTWACWLQEPAVAASDAGDLGPETLEGVNCAEYYEADSP